MEIYNKFKWGDMVQICTNAPPQCRPKVWGSVVGLRKIEDDETVALFKVKKNSILYLVEFEDGFSTEIPEVFLESIKKH